MEGPPCLKNPQVFMPRSSGRNWGQQTGENLGEAERVKPDPGQKKAPGEGRFWGRLMAAKQRSVVFGYWL